jgi:hypothetical protein
MNSFSFGVNPPDLTVLADVCGTFYSYLPCPHYHAFEQVPFDLFHIDRCFVLVTTAIPSVEVLQKFFFGYTYSLTYSVELGASTEGFVFVTGKLLKYQLMSWINHLYLHTLPPLGLLPLSHAWRQSCSYISKTTWKLLPMYVPSCLKLF